VFGERSSGEHLEMQEARCSDGDVMLPELGLEELVG
jgi:hypothetical protein